MNAQLRDVRVLIALSSVLLSRSLGQNAQLNYCLFWQLNLMTSHVQFPFLQFLNRSRRELSTQARASDRRSRAGAFSCCLQADDDRTACGKLSRSWELK